MTRTSGWSNTGAGHAVAKPAAGHADELLAEVTNSSLSRLSHLVTRLEGRGLVRREPDPADGRFTNAILTGNGFRALTDAAPGHVAHVRSLVIDVLSPEQLRRLGCAADRIMSRIDNAGTS